MLYDGVGDFYWPGSHFHFHNVHNYGFHVKIFGFFFPMVQTDRIHVGIYAQLRFARSKVVEACQCFAKITPRSYYLYLRAFKIVFFPSPPSRHTLFFVLGAGKFHVNLVSFGVMKGLLKI